MFYSFQYPAYFLSKKIKNNRGSGNVITWQHRKIPKSVLGGPPVNNALPNTITRPTLPTAQAQFSKAKSKKFNKGVATFTTPHHKRERWLREGLSLEGLSLRINRKKISREKKALSWERNVSLLHHYGTKDKLDGVYGSCRGWERNFLHVFEGK